MTICIIAAKQLLMVTGSTIEQQITSQIAAHAACELANRYHSEWNNFL
jgi:hypothetical protein